MDVYVLDKTYRTIYMVGSFFSLIWTERYNTNGDFELHVPITKDNTENLKPGYFLQINESKETMVIETIERQVSKTAATLSVSGRSLFGLLYRRYLWNPITLSGNLKNAIKTVLNQNAISPSNSKRTIPGLYFKESSVGGNISIDSGEYFGETVYAVVSSLCREYKIGVRVRLEEGGNISFELYSGVDHSIGQKTELPVIFSPEFRNFSSIDYVYSTISYANAVRTSGTINGDAVYAECYPDGNEPSGFDRFEWYVSGGSESGEDVDSSAFLEELKTNAKFKNQDNMTYEVTNGVTDNTSQFVYGRDYQMGDIVTIDDGHGLSIDLRLTELVISQSESGFTIIPSFAKVGSDDE